MPVPIIIAAARGASVAARGGAKVIQAGARGVQGAAKTTARGVSGSARQNAVAQNARRFTVNRPSVRKDNTSKLLQERVRKQMFEGDQKGNDNRMPKNAADITSAISGVSSSQALRAKMNNKILSKTPIPKAIGRKVVAARNVFSTAPLLYSIASVVYIFIFIFGVVGLGLVLVGSYEIAGVSLDGVAETAQKPLEWIGVVDTPVTASNTGANVIAVATVFALAGYLVVGLCAIFMLRARFLHDQSLFILTVVTLGLSMLPVTQLFPWIIGWVFALQVAALKNA